jgi:hypothetical protein
MLKVLPAYALMMYNQGRHLAAAGRHSQAIELYRQVLAIDPGFSRARDALDDSERHSQ